MELLRKFFYGQLILPLTENKSLALITASILASLGVYYGLIFRQAPLAKYYGVPLYDLLAMIRTDPRTQGRLIIAFLLLASLYFLGWKAAQSVSHRRVAWIMVMVGIAASAAILLYLYPYDAADIFDNISHGRIIAIYHANPFQQVTIDFPQDPFFHYPGWPKVPSAYGPLWEMMAGLTASLAGDGIFENVIAFKLLPAIFVVISVALTAVFMLRVDPKRALSSVWLLGMNPLVLYETFGHGHNDMAMVVWIIAAVLAIDRRKFSLAILALVIGGLIKYIPLLLIPVAGVIALVELPNPRERLRFLILTGLGAAILVTLAYAPFWGGLETLTVERRTRLLTTSISSIVYNFLRQHIDAQSAAAWVTEISLYVTLLFSIWQADRAGRKSSLPLWLRFSNSGLNILLFYLLVTILWFHQWYLVWAIGLAVLLPPGPIWALALFNSFAVLAKPFVIAPLVFLKLSPQSPEWLELRLSVGVLALPWVAAVLALWNQYHHGRKKANRVEPKPEGKLTEQRNNSAT